ncbi:hypothetical protein BC332_04094 [Capsicum chinense]|nr:hypothetical protein BC332_04094 [Capsicum chinense]
MTTSMPLRKDAPAQDLASSMILDLKSGVGLTFQVQVLNLSSTSDFRASHLYLYNWSRYVEVDNSRTPFVPVAEKILRENMTEGDKLYVNNINGSTDEFTVFGYGPSTKVDLSRWSCSCRKYDLMKFPSAYAMPALLLKHGDEYDTSLYNYSLPI